MSTDEIIERLSVDPIWGCYTRPALELRWHEFSQNATGIVYGDIDNMHALNERYGHAGTDERIRSIISHVRHSDIVASRWLNGDELVFILKSGDPRAFCDRLHGEFGARGMRITLAYTRTVTDDAAGTITPLDEKVQASKNKGLKGVTLP